MRGMGKKEIRLITIYKKSVFKITLDIVRSTNAYILLYHLFDVSHQTCHIVFLSVFPHI